MFGKEDVCSLCFKSVGMQKGGRGREKQEVTALQEDLSGYVKKMYLLFFVYRFCKDLCVW